MSSRFNNLFEIPGHRHLKNQEDQYERHQSQSTVLGLMAHPVHYVDIIGSWNL